ncbi:hypothetical protein FOMPIDRAFT_82249 [Fomitopsis schrenkii]|uniref:Uncharacterized protein n=1 Tax=Fomitopsis schrenkii TaxID=2126942 RepID=S8EH43_FOMSC|nr:hypothetical protein FOMPIDRAFT_82249 [Fomitopsis schrenkii]
MNSISIRFEGQDALVTGFGDPNLDEKEAVEFEDDSPYPEVRSAVANTDDFNMLHC